MNRARNPNRKRNVKRGLAGAIAALLIALGMFLRGCFGFGSGDGKGEGEVANVQPDAQAIVDATPKPTTCELRLDSKGLFLNGDSISIEDAVTRCRKLGKARLRVTGGARSGSYDELKQAFTEANVVLDVHDTPVPDPPSN